MKEGDVVLTPIPQADGVIKNRPAIILREMPPYRDFLVCGVSTQLDKEVKGFDEVIDVTDDDVQIHRLKNHFSREVGLPRGSSEHANHRRHRFLIFDTPP